MTLIERAFAHQACIYGSDDEFLALAVPFARGGLARNEPVLAVTTQANIALLGQVPLRHHPGRTARLER